MLKPLGDRIVVKPLDAEEKTSGGIVLPDSAKERPQTGEVIAVGPGKTLDNGTVAPMEVNIGDKVVYSKYGGTEVKVDGQDVLIMRQDDILGVVEG
jgi:chaperonin GroES